MRLRPPTFPLLGTALLAPLVAQAQQGIIVAGIPGCDFQTGNVTAACIPRFIGHIVQLVFLLIGVFFLMNIMFAGYQIIFAAFQGSDSSKGKNRLIYSIVGFLVAAGTFYIMDVILTTVLGPSA